MKDYRQLEIWRRSHIFALTVYRLTKTFPKDELFALTSQIRRAAVSVPANIVEGCGRDGDGELKRFLDISHGSAAELEYLMLLSHELGYLSQPEHASSAAEIAEIKRMLGGLVRKLKADR